MSVFFGWQDGNQGNIGSANIPSDLYDPSSELPTKVVWDCPPQYPPDDCNKPISWTPKQLQSLFSNLYSFTASLARFKNRITGQVEHIKSCDGIDAPLVLGSYFDYLTGQIVAKDDFAKEIAALSCAAANDPNSAVMPLPEDAIMIIRKGATPSSTCQMYSTNIDKLSLYMYNLTPRVQIYSLGGIYQYSIWATSSPNATEELQNLSGDTLGYVSLTTNMWATVEVTDLNSSPTYYWAAP
jgi:hypothetical protein